MPTTTYDRGPDTHDFAMVDLLDVMGVDIVIDPSNKLWINVNGKCLLRVGKVYHLTVDNKGQVE